MPATNSRCSSTHRALKLRPRQQGRRGATRRAVRTRQYLGKTSTTLSFDLHFDTADEGTPTAPVSVRTAGQRWSSAFVLPQGAGHTKAGAAQGAVPLERARDRRRDRRSHDRLRSVRGEWHAATRQDVGLDEGAGREVRAACRRDRARTTARSTRRRRATRGNGPGSDAPDSRSIRQAIER